MHSRHKQTKSTCDRAINVNREQVLLDVLSIYGGKFLKGTHEMVLRSYLDLSEYGACAFYLFLHSYSNIYRIANDIDSLVKSYQSKIS